MRGTTLLPLALALGACFDYPDKEAARGNPYEALKPDLPAVETDDRTTWHKDVRAIVEANCTRCHRDGGAGPMPLDTYAATDGYRDTMVAYAESGHMPPWPFDVACNDLAFDRSLSELDIDTLKAWQADAFPPGLESDYVAPEDDATFDPAGEVEVALSHGDSTPSGAGARCFALAPPPSADATLDPRGWWVTDARIDADGNAAQATLYVVPAAAAGAVPSDDFDCANLPADALALYAWVPGKDPLSFEQETALLVENGSRFVLKVQWLAGGVADTTRATVWRYSGKRTPNEAQVGLHRAFAAGPAVEGGVEVYLPRSEEIFAITPEMTDDGASFQSEYMTGPVGRCLGRSPAWDARFPETLVFDEEEHVNARLGNRLRLTCTYNDGGAASGCAATVLATFPRYDSIQPLGQTCSGVDQCVLSCSQSTNCLLDCLAWELPACGACARAQLFEGCAATVNPTQHGVLASCETEHCAAADGYAPWLQCMLANCGEALAAMQTTLVDELPSGACNRDNESCVYFVPAEP